MSIAASERTRRFRLAAIVALGVSATVFLGTRPAAAEAGDPWLTAKTKIALMTAEDVGGYAINVDTYDSIVTLHGKVSTANEKSRAAEIAKTVKGVKEIRNLLQVVPEVDQDAVEVEDSKLKESVSTVLERDAALDDSDIGIKSVNNGVVLLSGEAKTISDHLRALEDARAVEGVERVASEIRSPDKLSDSELWYGEKRGKGPDVASGKAADKADKTADKAAGTRDDAEESSYDAWTTAAVKLKLLSNRDVPGLDINVDTRAGAVTLFGRVPAASTKELAEKLARETNGVRVVKNELQVVPEAQQEQVSAKDESIQEQLEKRIADNPELQDANVKLEVSKGVVRLTGTVENENDHLAVLTTTRATQGVRSLIDEIEIAERQAKK
jgi:osmotically-inducible protein OsmY